MNSWWSVTCFYLNDVRHEWQYRLNRKQRKSWPFLCNRSLGVYNFIDTLWTCINYYFRCVGWRYRTEWKLCRRRIKRGIHSKTSAIFACRKLQLFFLYNERHFSPRPSIYLTGSYRPASVNVVKIINYTLSQDIVDSHFDQLLDTCKYPRIKIMFIQKYLKNFKIFPFKHSPLHLTSFNALPKVWCLWGFCIATVPNDNVEKLCEVI